MKAHCQVYMHIKFFNVISWKMWVFVFRRPKEKHFSSCYVQFLYFLSFQILPDLGRSRSVVGVFRILEKNDPITSSTSPKPNVAVLTYFHLIWLQCATKPAIPNRQFEFDLTYDVYGDPEARNILLPSTIFSYLSNNLGISLIRSAVPRSGRGGGTRNSPLRQSRYNYTPARLGLMDICRLTKYQSLCTES